MSTKIDKFETALANGYAPGQAAVISKWPLIDFMRFIQDMVRGDDEQKVWVFEDGSQQKERARAAISL